MTWRVRIASWLRRLALWLDGPSDALWPSVVEITAQADRMWGSTVSGAYKRQWVLSTLLKRHHAVRRRRLGYLIECVLNGQRPPEDA